MQKLPGITQKAEEQKLRRTITVAQNRLDTAKRSVQALADELHEMLEIFDEEDKEAMALWHNTDSMYRQVNLEVRRADQARKKPYFGRIDFQSKYGKEAESYYIGRSVIADDPLHPEVIDWRAPIASVYYESGLGDVSYQVKGEGHFEISLLRKRTYEIEQDTLKAFYDSDVVANDELLTKYLSKNKSTVLNEIIATIQKEQNEIIRRKPQHNLIVQGAAGSGKTTVAMHRISYILYNYEKEFAPEDFYIIGSNQILLDYITGVLPELGVYGVSQMTMEQLFIRLLYEDWDPRYTVRPVVKGVTPPVKGTLSWFRDLETFCERLQWELIPRREVRLEATGALLMTGEEIEAILRQNRSLSRADKIGRLTELLTVRLENEISGKYFSYPPEEQKRLLRRCKIHFGRREWKGSVVALYDDFLKEQRNAGHPVDLPDGCFDVYDLAALAYLYKCIKESETIREAGHVVIDEAQDFGMMVYASLVCCLSKCTYTVMGDVSQNISLDYGLNDWAELRSLLLPGEFDYFGLLRKSYRNTIEISRFATDILYHGSFQIYPVDPIIRHGNEVSVRACPDFDALVEETAAVVTAWQQSGYETIAVICSDADQADRVTDRLRGRLPLLLSDHERLAFGAGVMVLPLEATKGLEFDAVLLFDASAEHYPAKDGYVKRLYVASTRALHELTVLYQGELTPLIAEPVPEGRKHHAVLEPTAPKQRILPVKTEKTNRELQLELAREGELELQRRKLYGPRRIVTQGTNAKKPETAGGARQGQEARPDSRLARESWQTQDSRQVRGSRQTQDSRLTQDRQQEQKLRQAQELRQGQNPHQGAAAASTGSGNSYRQTQKSSSAATKRTRPFISGESAPTGEFGTMPDSSILRPIGHSRIDCSVRFVMKEGSFYSLRGSYGTLRVIILAEGLVRIFFSRQSSVTLPPALSDFGQMPENQTAKAQAAQAGQAAGGRKVRYRVRENPSVVEFETEKLLIRVDKKTGALSFFNSRKELLLCERAREPRQLGLDRVWEYFDWKKGETLVARGSTDKRQQLIGPSTALYISFGPDSARCPAILSPKGYTLFFPPRRKTLCCNIPLYGPYISIEGTDFIDYYFKINE